MSKFKTSYTLSVNMKSSVLQIGGKLNFYQSCIEVDLTGQCTDGHQTAVSDTENWGNCCGHVSSWLHQFAALTRHTCFEKESLIAICRFFQYEHGSFFFLTNVSVPQMYTTKHWLKIPSGAVDEVVVDAHRLVSMWYKSIIQWLHSPLRGADLWSKNKAQCHVSDAHIQAIFTCKLFWCSDS